MNLTLKLQNVLFLDIETVPQKENWETLSLEEQTLFSLKTQYQRKEDTTAKAFYEKAGIWAEFGKIICISVGYFVFDNQEKQLRITSYYGDNEKQILTDFKNLLDTHFNKKQHVLCAHNGKELVKNICL